MKLWTVVACAAIGTMMGCDGGVENQDRIDAIVALDGDAVAGETAFQANCSSCHKEDATGGTGPSLVGKTDKELMATQVLNGGATMPPLADTLDDQTIADIIAWILTLGAAA